MQKKSINTAPRATISCTSQVSKEPTVKLAHLQHYYSRWQSKGIGKAKCSQRHHPTLGSAKLLTITRISWLVIQPLQKSQMPQVGKDNSLSSPNTPGYCSVQLQKQWPSHLPQYPKCGKEQKNYRQWHPG